MTSPVAARKHFDQAMALLDTDVAGAAARFREATEVDPSMADAWLGRIAAGDEALSTIEQLYNCGSRLHRETNRIGARLSAPIKAGPYLSISVTEASHAGLALASALIDAGQYEKAEALLADSTLLDTWENHQWKQYIEAYLMFATQRWPDVVSVAAAILPPQAIIMSAVTAAICTLAAHGAAHLGQARVALEWTDRVELRTGYGGTEARRQQLETAVTAIDPNDFPLIAADLAYVRGMAHRQLGEEAKAQIWLSKATINGALLEPAKQALADPALQLVVTDEQSIRSRTNKWDVTTERSAQQREEEEHQERRSELLQEGRALLDNQVGLADVKRAVAELEDQIEVRALRLAAGLPVANQTNHMLLVGPPGTGKTTTAEALGKIYAGLGIVRHPEIIEVKRADFCAEHIGASGPKTNELINRSLGRILFMDEFYSLVERHQDGRPDMIGMEAVNQLLVALEVHRFDFCFIGAGYEKEVDEFLTVNPGLAGRFNRKLRFESYTPDELVEIAVRYGKPRATLLDPATADALRAACATLRDYRAPNGEHGIDVMHNGRFARNVVERAERLRDSRVAAQHRMDKGSVTVADLQTLRTQDIVAAVKDACTEKHVPIVL
ncbi:type VII secretion AAA-ATPase EccA [Mycobacterium sherrisii]|uniref:Type VII secretion AAA-ATPase EccA n=1 Tax=Mycobacterium sherrisii TaxID=243061 RepID=A0A1E3SR31_9MYCO|nr:type VII secretion AAA-ATPase EccA [Mycobacterium sherrisii]MCV7029397.1 type VII secretion AAA-ATPase EccA [Mycobacterium sherrisii]MEC4761537.1 type VII secretion AAA-ATPase EccA [Mycobacterium sherrisii]ODR04572.1 type VII secretion AAA-ATPase EccA [Mycobacterium sherrisii]ORW82038.1 type VII secretion AAA-ATPase EccA [Mycobacterium sherrisii]